MTTYDTIRVDVDAEGIAQLTIHRPEQRNALNATVREEVKHALKALAEDPRVRVLVLTGAGDKSFVSGADVKEFLDRSAEEQAERSSFPRIYEAVEAFPLPVIAAINGWCLGGGNELALACDIRIASDRARVGQPEIRLGLIPGGGGTQRLARLVGRSTALRLAATGDILDAEEAHELGLVDAVVPHDELLEHVRDLAGRMASKSPVALTRVKEAVKLADEHPLREGLKRERDLFVSMFETEDMREGIRAFLEDRDPEWTGR